MDLELKPVTNETKAAFMRWQLLRGLIRKSEAMISEAISRIDRANRLRTMAPKIATGKQATILAKAAEYETEAHGHLALVPAYYEFFKEELVKVRKQVEGGIGNE